MNIQSALKEQYHAALAMLADCIQKCPDDLWTTPSRKDVDPDEPGRFCVRSFWRIAFHGIFFTHLYLGQNEDAFQPPPENLAVRKKTPAGMWGKPWDAEPYELPDEAEPPTQRELLEYIAYLDGILDSTIDGLDLDSPESGIPWYKNFGKLSHELLTLRHLQGHVGQLSELLLARCIDTDWISRAASYTRS